jgi:hypothetical protein
MSDAPRPDRRLTEAQAEAILRRAAELQAASDGAGTQADGVGLEQLTEAAAEVGVSSEMVRKAASEVLAGSRPQPRRPAVWGAFMPITDRIILGRLHDDDLPELLEELREISGTASWSAKGGEFTWQTRSGLALRLTHVGRNTRLWMSMPTGGCGCFSSFAVSAFGTLLAVFVAISVSDISGTVLLWSTAAFAAALGAATFALTFRPMQRARERRLSEANRIQTLLESRIRAFPENDQPKT